MDEAALVALMKAGDFERAARGAIERYGAEVYGFLINLLGAESDATEGYLQVGEDL